MKAQYGATRARLRVSEALTGYSKTATGIGADVRRFEDRFLTLRARARALESVAIGPAIGSIVTPVYVEGELTMQGVSPRVEDELRRLQGELPSAPAAPQVKGAADSVPQLEAAHG